MGSPLATSAQAVVTHLQRTDTPPEQPLRYVGGLVGLVGPVGLVAQSVLVGAGVFLRSRRKSRRLDRS